MPVITGNCVPAVPMTCALLLVAELHKGLDARAALCKLAHPDREGAIKKREACPEKSIHLEKGSDHLFHCSC